MIAKRYAKLTWEVQYWHQIFEFYKMQQDESSLPNQFPDHEIKILFNVKQAHQYNLDRLRKETHKSRKYKMNIVP